MSSSAAAPQLLPKAAPQAEFAFSFGAVFRLLSICLRFPQSNLDNWRQVEFPLPCRQVLGWVTSQNSLLAQFSTKNCHKFLSWEIRGSGEVPKAFPLCWALTVDARETGAGTFNTGILYHLEIPCEAFLVDNRNEMFTWPQAFPATLPLGFVFCASAIPKGVVSLLLL